VTDAGLTLVAGLAITFAFAFGASQELANRLEGRERITRS
jgi:hypothetical protein